MERDIARDLEDDLIEPLEGDFGPHLREDCPDTGICLRHAVT